MSTKTTINAGYTAQAISITALTNIHVGSGKNDYGIIDNVVQRDALTGFPTINSSSFKGALRQYCTANWKDANAIRHIFGADTKKGEESQGGAYVFMTCQLLSIPIRSDVRPFFRVTCPAIIKDFLQIIDNFGLELTFTQQLKQLANTSALYLGEQNIGKKIMLEGIELEVNSSSDLNISKLTNFLGEDLIIVRDEQFNELCSQENLPVIARNSLENGVSKNLWYEQILPRQTRFVSIVLYPKNDIKAGDFFTQLHKKPIQIGANASIGYGFCNLQTL